MDSKTNVKPEAPPSNDDLSNGKTVNVADPSTRIKIETTTSDNAFETCTKRSIKVEAIVNLGNEGQCFYEHLETNANNDPTTSNHDFEMVSKIYIKEEPTFPDTELPNVEYLDCTSLAAEIKNETVRSNECKMESKIVDKKKESVSDTSSEIGLKPFSVDLKMINKESITCSDSDEETVTKQEIGYQSKAPAVADILHAANVNKESDSGMAEDSPSSESTRFASAVVHHDGGSHTIPYASDVLIHTGSKPFKCEHCGKCFTWKQNLDKHTLVHTGSKPFKCEHCDKSFTWKQNLNKHTLVHTGSKPFKCEHCGKCFTWKQNLDKHTLVHTGSKPFKCEYCGTCFRQKSYLKTHTLVHTGSKPFKCEHCDKCFTQKNHLKSHTLNHSGSKPYKCEQCGKGFTWKQSLEKHTLVHTGSKPFKCEHCDKCFTQKSHLKSHTLNHSDSKPFKCEHCGKCFTWKQNLDKHILIHTGSKPFKCEHCDKCFTSQSNLKTHTLVHTGSKPFRCAHCGKYFTRNSSLKRHVLLH